MLAYLVSAALVGAVVPAPVDETGIAFQDGPRLVLARRLAPAQVELFYPELGRSVVAGQDDSAIIRYRGTQLDDLLTTLGLRLVRPLMPAAGLYRVADARGSDDGLALAARLAPH